jgi:hypothetical protein
VLKVSNAPPRVMMAKELIHGKSSGNRRERDEIDPLYLTVLNVFVKIDARGDQIHVLDPDRPAIRDGVAIGFHAFQGVSRCEGPTHEIRVSDLVGDEVC